MQSVQGKYYLTLSDLANQSQIKLGTDFFEYENNKHVSNCTT